MIDGNQWPALGPLLFIADGSTTGIVTVATTQYIRAGQKGILKSDTQTEGLSVRVQSVDSATTFTVTSGVNKRAGGLDVSAFTLADNATVLFPIQDKSPLTPENERNKQLFEEAPVIARRVVQVDELGEIVGSYDPLAHYTLHDVDENSNTITYLGKMKKDGTWLVIRITETGKDTVFEYANITNNPTQLTYTTAYTNRATLTYTELQNLTGI